MASAAVERKDCRSCGGVLETIHDFGEVPIINFGDREDIKAPLELTKCVSCALVQLRHTLDREKLFRRYYYRSGVNQTMRDHLRGIVEEVQKRVGLGVHDLVIDIGSNDMTTLRFYPERVYKLGFEPSNILDAGGSVSNIFRVADFFSFNNFLRFVRTGPELDFTERKQAKVITAIAMFYDLDDPNAFLQDVKKVLAPDGLLVIEQAYLPEMLRTNNVTNIVHEHLCYYSLMTLERLLTKHGLGIEDVEFSDINGGVFRVYVRHFGDWMKEEKDWSLNKPMSAEMHSGLDKMETYTYFISRVFEQAARLHEFVESETQAFADVPEIAPKTIDIYGPSTRGLMLLQMAGLEAKHFRWAVDRNPEKVGKTYHGVPVVSEETMRKDPPDYLLVLPYSFLGEFVAREMEILRAGTKMLVPLPQPFLLSMERV